MRQGTEIAVKMCEVHVVDVHAAHVASTFTRHIFTVLDKSYFFPSLGAFEPFTSPPAFEREVKLPQHIDATRRESEAPGKTFVVSANIFSPSSKASVTRRVFEGHLASGRATRDRRGHERGARWK